MKAFKPGWYEVSPYFTAHFFHKETGSVCGIKSDRKRLKPAKKNQTRCDGCQRGTGRKE